MVGEWMKKEGAKVMINGASIAANSINVNSLVVNEDFNVKIMNANYSNLLINSNIPITKKKYLINTYTMTENFKTDTKYTVTIKGQLGNDSNNFGLATGDQWLTDNIKLDTTNNLYTGTFTVSEKFSSFNDLRVYARPNPDPNDKTEKTTIEWIVLKKGDLDVATKWSPSSLDINAENIITSINADKSGVTISGDKVKLTGNFLDFTANTALEIKSPNFTVSNKGEIKATKGTIGGVTIKDGSISSNGPTDLSKTIKSSENFRASLKNDGDSYTENSSGWYNHRFALPKFTTKTTITFRDL
jgi:hypothetical protein